MIRSIQLWKRLISLILGVILFYTTNVYSSDRIQLSGKSLMKCHDGDTCTFKRGRGDHLKVRIFGIDAPEKKQPNWELSQRYLIQRIRNASEVELECTSQSFDRKVCKIFIDQEDLGEEMIRKGLVWEARSFTRGLYTAAQAQAQREHLGLWQPGGEPPIEPRCFRKPASCKK